MPRDEIECLDCGHVGVHPWLICPNCGSGREARVYASEPAHDRALPPVPPINEEGSER